MPQETERDCLNEFKTYHPIVNFIYFVAVIGFSCFLMHPVCLAISLTCSFAYAAMLAGKRAAVRIFLALLPVLILAALMNPAFNHGGITILAYLPSGNPLTLESVVYGLVAAALLLSVVLWFFCYSAVMTSDKFIYLFGRMIPSMSLVLSMTLRFVPRFVGQFQKVAAAQKCIGRDISSGSLRHKMKHAFSILSIMVTWSLENAVDTADSMKARGYGLPNRTAFSIFVFSRRDAMFLAAILVFGAHVLAGLLAGRMDFAYFPGISALEFSPYHISIFAAYLLLCGLPVISELWEVRRWKAFTSKI